MHNPLIALSLAAICAASVSAPAAAQGCTTDDFEAFAISAGGATSAGVLMLDENTIAQGQGPGLVEDGCTYSVAGGNLQWNGDAYYSLVTKTICGSSTPDGSIYLDYDQPVSQVDMDLSTFAGYPETATVTAYDAAGAMLTTQTLSIAATGAQHPISLSATGIERVVVKGVNSWSPMIDNHVYCAGPAGPSLALFGNCGQAGSGVSGSGYTPGGFVAIGYSFQAGAFVLPNGGCAGTQLGIVVPILAALLPADANGDFSYPPANGVPNGACGAVHAQAVDVMSCTPSNVLSL